MPIELPPRGLYRLDPAATRIEITATHGLRWPVRGRFSLLSGQIDVPADPTDSILTVSLDAASIDTGNRLRDFELRSPMFLAVKRYPSIDFSSAGPHRHEGDLWLIDGTVTAHGLSVATTLTITDLSLNTHGFTAKATARVDRYAHGVTGARGVAGQHLDLAITAVALR